MSSWKRLTVEFKKHFDTFVKAGGGKIKYIKIQDKYVKTKELEDSFIILDHEELLIL